MRFVRGRVRNNRILLPVGIRAFVDDPLAPPNLSFYEFTALVDTGATRTAISQNVIEKVGLKPCGQMEVGNVKRTELHETFLFYVGVWLDADADTRPAFFGVGDEVLGIDGGDSRYYDILLGMDIIRRGSLMLDASGDFELGFPD